MTAHLSAVLGRDASGRFPGFAALIWRQLLSPAQPGPVGGPFRSAASRRLKLGEPLALPSTACKWERLRHLPKPFRHLVGAAGSPAADGSSCTKRLFGATPGPRSGSRQVHGAFQTVDRAPQGNLGRVNLVLQAVSACRQARAAGGPLSPVQSRCRSPFARLTPFSAFRSLAVAARQRPCCRSRLYPD